MSSNTKIVVLRSKEIIYALVLLIIVVLIIIVTASIFMLDENKTTNPSPAANSRTEDENGAETESQTESQTEIETAKLYVPGIYSNVIQLGSSNIELQISVDSNHINSIAFTNIDDSIATMYPLVEPTLNELSAEILSSQNAASVSIPDENRYTALLLKQAIQETINKALCSENSDSPPETSHSVTMD